MEQAVGACCFRFNGVDHFKFADERPSARPASIWPSKLHSCGQSGHAGNEDRPLMRAREFVEFASATT